MMRLKTQIKFLETSGLDGSTSNSFAKFLFKAIVLFYFYNWIDSSNCSKALNFTKYP